MWLTVIILASTASWIHASDVDPCMKPCNKMLKPVCGSDGNVYSNHCLLEIASCQADGVIREVPMGQCEKRDVDPCMKPCNKIYMPVCGSDGKVYNNICLLEIASCQSDGVIRQVPMGQCEKRDVDPCMKPCNKIYMPVCGSDGKVYNNICLLEVASCQSDGVIRQVPMGQCEKRDVDPCMKPCNKIYMPVCGSDGKVYNNICLLEIASCQSDGVVRQVPMGQCEKRDVDPCMKPCNKIYMPVCGSDGKIYNNICLLEIASCQSDEVVRQVPMGQCEKRDVDPCMKPCNKIYMPVCGSDGEVYNNICLLEIASCQSDGVVRQVPMGQCEKRDVDPCMKPCNKIYMPVCGSDGKVYNNICLLEIASCQSDGVVRQVPMGQCEKRDVDPCMKPCNKIYMPVCGSDGKVYNNICLLEIASCQSDGVIRQVPMGQCEKRDVDPCMKACNKMLDPVCGSDGNVYSNRCLMEIASCQADGFIREVPMGHCEKRQLDSCDRACPAVWDPLCGSNGRVYPNKCEFIVAVCKSDGALREVPLGQCMKREADSCFFLCPKTMHPVCGSDGNVYDNSCEMEKAACTTDTTIRRVPMGQC